jgi:putative sporulation protein YyaC
MILKEYSLDNLSLKNFALDVLKRLNLGEVPVFLCVGSDKFVCDSLGPIVGEMLTKKYNINAYVYGGVDYNINANNLSQAINYVETEHPRSQIILVDATLGDNVGNVVVTNSSFAGLGKVLPIRKIGNFSILGVISKKTKTFDLNTTKFKIVLDLAKFISKGIAMAVDVHSQGIDIEHKSII